MSSPIAVVLHSPTSLRQPAAVRRGHRSVALQRLCAGRDPARRYPLAAQGPDRSRVRDRHAQDPGHASTCCCRRRSARCCPTIISQLVVTLKDTSLGCIILYPELLQTVRADRQQHSVNGEYHATSRRSWSSARSIVAMCLLLSALATWIEKRGRRAKTGIAMGAGEAPPMTPTVRRRQGPVTGGRGERTRRLH